MTWLTKVPVNRRRREAPRFLTDPQVMHAAVASSFGQEDPGRTLWRLDEVGDLVTLWVQSPARPDLTHVVEAIGWPTVLPGWESRELDPLLARLSSGMGVGYRVTVNPTRVEAGKRKPHITLAHQTQWWLSQSTGAGLEIDPASTTLVRRDSWRFQRGTGSVALTTATFEGVAVVRDSAALREAMVAGIGRAKAYGCGLLTVVPRW